MPKRILIRAGENGKWFGYTCPIPKMPDRNSVREWKDFETMVVELKPLNVNVVVTSDDLITRLAEQGIEAVKINYVKTKNVR